MKIAITSKGTDLNAQIDPRFGRAENFIIYNEEDKSIKVISNSEGMNAAHGAGVQASQTVINEGVKAAIAGDFGPKASNLLQQAGVTKFNFANGTVSDAIEAFNKSK